MPSSTLRSWVIGLIFAIVMSGLNQFFFFRYPSVFIGNVSPHFPHRRCYVRRYLRCQLPAVSLAICSVSRAQRLRFAKLLARSQLLLRCTHVLSFPYSALCLLCPTMLTLFVLVQLAAQLLTFPCGRAWARFMPNVTIFGVRINPGPFTVKEHVRHHFRKSGCNAKFLFRCSRR